MTEGSRRQSTITVDGKEIDAAPGELVIAAAERHGTYIPRFCYHPRMEPVGMCRMCVVEIDTGRGPALQPACMIPVADGMVVDTESEVTKKAQDGVLEFLLINHPLDCPVCDKGGECPLQDQTMAYGPGESRFVEEKRHFAKPIPISDLVDLDRERCILCDRCTRFAKDVAGDPLISFIDRGNQTQVNTFPDHEFASYFSGNTVQICPVGALTSSAYRFKARPWDLDQAESTCTTCSVGCRVVVQSSRNEVLRYQGVDVDPVNWGWLCDKGRFDFQAVNSADRLDAPLARSTGNDLAPTSWGNALGTSASAIREALDRSGPQGIAVLGGARLTNESAYAWAKLAKGVIGTDHVDAQMGDGVPAEVVLGLPRATIDEACTPGGTVLLLGPDLKEELPVLFLRLRHAVENDGVKIVELTSVTGSTSGLAAHTLLHRPGDAGEVVRSLLTGGTSAAAASRPRCSGRLPPSSTPDRHRGPRAPQRGRVGRGCGRCRRSHPPRPPGGSLPLRLAARQRAWRPRHGPGTWHLARARHPGVGPFVVPRPRAGPQSPPSGVSMPWGMLEAAAAGRVDVLLLLGADPLADSPDRSLARRALAGARTVIAVDQFRTASVETADVVLAAAGYAEVDGTTTNLEGRISVLNRKVTAPGTARADWIIAAELARRLGADLGLESVAQIWAEVEAGCPQPRRHHRRAPSFGRRSDGVVAPLRPVGEGGTGDRGGRAERSRLGRTGRRCCQPSPSRAAGL